MGNREAIETNKKSEKRKEKIQRKRRRQIIPLVFLNPRVDEKVHLTGEGGWRRRRPFDQNMGFWVFQKFFFF